MGSLLENSRLSHEIIDDFNKNNEKVIREQEQEYESRYDRLEAIKEAAKLRSNKFIEYKDNVKSKLLFDSLYSIYEASIPAITEHEQAVGRSLVMSYINENGAATIVNGFKGKTIMLSELHDVITKYYNIITEEATAENPDSQVIDPADYDNFHKELRDISDMEDITNTIRIRVANAEEEFITNNLNDKMATDDIIKTTADRVNAIKQDSDSYENPEDAEVAQEEAANLQKQLVHSIRNERRRSVFEQMAHNLSSSIIKNAELHESYGNKDNGGLDMDKVISSARCMYTMLEMVNTTKMEVVDEQYIENALISL